MGEHFGCGLGDEAAQLVEAQNFAGQMPQEQCFIFAADKLQRGGNGTVDVNSIFHLEFPFCKEQGD
ncbi:hypothetical protein HMPREF9443_01487 [Phascolarctobacterium succinatutens YIT 12067]|uniref:Uncharacterized protein n=1 Tax=Phascolarctobacterium succinatutens YIT 12067 TaxID=626939 RepID=E8LF53_9FIRM|nr:hypothetical protein HMPREF9443_01487 [Phascolarctobacterium succinatutens YIT 12067]